MTRSAREMFSIVLLVSLTLVSLGFVELALVPHSSLAHELTQMH